ncbi:hypothetical protein M378DRAFT_124069 [Amanita muscaria Koide BX008]|uniref:Uncharacterized protein n=1 Tax=Amanita muscaria (strain Koide BX008) TaxID=946122 RepID=A0A0C2XAY5_AMAMK|nr:hypothetical protein M378DRAFT_124069 [Amanita muscaria Koide BX008]
MLAITTEDDTKLYNANTHSFIHTLPLHRDGGDIPPAFSPDCTRLAVEDARGNVNLWDLRGIDASSPPSKGNATAVTALTLSRDCSRLACGFWDGTVELRETSPTKRRIDPLAPLSEMETLFYRIFRQSRHTRSVQALGFDPDGRLFASGSNDGTIKLWNGGDGALLVAHTRHRKAVATLGYNPNGRRFASVSVHGTINLWDVEGGALCGALRYPTIHGLDGLAVEIC